MTDIAQLSVGEVVRRITSNIRSKRIAFIKSFPLSSMQESAVAAAGMDMVEMQPQALDFLAGTYANTGPYDIAAKLGEATYRLAKTLYQQGDGDLDTRRMIAGRGALNWIAGLKQLGKHKEALRAIEEPLTWLTEIEDTTNLDMLRLKRVEIEIDLQCYDAAEKHILEIHEDMLPPMVQVTLRAHKNQLEKRKGGGMELSDEYPEYSSQDLINILSGTPPSEPKKTITAEEGKVLLEVSQELIKSFFGGDRGAVNEFTVRQQIIDASYLFTHPTKGRDPIVIAKIIPILIHGRDWMHENNFTDSENDACWSLYLAYSRTNREVLAARELQRLRENIERARSTIADPSERSRLSARYPYLYQSLSMMLYEIGDVYALFEVIEASKGRVLADLQTLRRGMPADEAEFSQSIRALPAMIRYVGSTYITYLVDDDTTFAVLMNRCGELSMHKVELGISEIESFAATRDPRLWGKRDPETLEYVPSVAEGLAPLVLCLDEIARDTKAEHLCYSPSGPLLSLPLHCAHLNGQPLAKRFSVSRIHGAASLYQLLASNPTRPNGFLSIEVPAVQDLANAGKIAALGIPGEWLEQNIGSGVRLRDEAGNTSTLKEQVTQDRIVHFATHGTFPDKPDPNRNPNPYYSSGVVLASNGSLPDLNTIFQNGTNLLSPGEIVDMQFDFSQSHVTLEACVTGLAKASAGGDALGLEFALLQLGAQSILSTHWDSNAQSMTEFIINFYYHWLTEKKSRVVAWREAVLQHIKKYGDSNEGTYHWAAFSLTGDWRWQCLTNSWRVCVHWTTLVCLGFLKVSGKGLLQSSISIVRHWSNMLIRLL